MIISHFEDIRNKILVELEKAQKKIIVAVYWFTCQELFEKLLFKLNSGVEVELIIHNDYINNRGAGLAFQALVDAGCKFFFSDEANPMHNKFCVIDKTILINGSYNWTYYAESKNQENVLIISHEPEVISNFLQEFNRLKKFLIQERQIKRLTKFEIGENNSLRTRDYLAHDMIYKAKALNDPQLVKTAFDLAPNNLAVQKAAYSLKLIKRCKLAHTISVEIVNDNLKVIATKGATVPAIFSTTTRTSKDDQTKTSAKIVYGEFQKASQNKLLAQMDLENLPAMPAGELEIKFTFSIDMSGKVRIVKLSRTTGESTVFGEECPWLIES